MRGWKREGGSNKVSVGFSFSSFSFKLVCFPFPRHAIYICYSFCSLIILKTLRCLHYDGIHAMHAHTSKLMATRNLRIDMNGHKIIVGAPETTRLKSHGLACFPYTTPCTARRAFCMWVCLSVGVSMFVQKVQNIHFIYAKANQAHTTSIYMWKPKKTKLNKMKTKRVFGEWTTTSTN